MANDGAGYKKITNLSCGTSRSGSGGQGRTYIQMVNNGVATGNPLTVANVNAAGADWATSVRHVKNAARLMAAANMNVTPYNNLRRLEGEASEDGNAASAVAARLAHIYVDTY